jgi:hypothetical protein
MLLVLAFCGMRAESTGRRVAWWLCQCDCGAKHETRGASYPDYGGRGIKVCQRWDSFEAFLEDMGECPNDNHSIERKDVDGNYDPENCVWLPLPLQARNKRNNRRITIGDDTRTLAEWCELYAVRRELVKDRLKLGWDPFDALTLSPGSRRPRSESIL